MTTTTTRTKTYAPSGLWASDLNVPAVQYHLTIMSRSYRSWCPPSRRKISHTHTHTHTHTQWRIYGPGGLL